jgi:hypothetical protein
MDQAFLEILAKKISEDELCKRLSAITSSIEVDNKPTDKSYTVTIVKNVKEPFFGTRIFPVLDDMNAITDSLIYQDEKYSVVREKWFSCKNWVIEIDENLFDRSKLNLIPKELTALLIHEMAHSVYSDSIIERMYRMYQESYIHMKYEEKRSLRIMHQLYAIPFTVACQIRNWSLGENGIKEEFYCDNMVGNTDYRRFIVSALGKIIKAYGNANILNEKEKDSLVSSSIVWCNLNINDLIRRRNRLKDDMVYNSIKTSSKFLKDVYAKLLNNIGVSMRERYTGAVVESSIGTLETDDFVFKYETIYDLDKIAVFEQAINHYHAPGVALEYFKGREPKMVSDYDVDVIGVEVDKISNHQDRIFVLELIYNKIQDLEIYKEYISYNSELKKRYDRRIDTLLERLEGFRNAVMAKKNLTATYKTFVKVPEGYEG